MPIVVGISTQVWSLGLWWIGRGAGGGWGLLGYSNSQTPNARTTLTEFYSAEFRK